MKNYFWWKSVIFNRMVGQYFAIVKQESFSMLSFLQDGLGVEEGQRLIGCGGKGSVSVAITRYTSTCEVLRRTLGTPITSHTAGPETPNWKSQWCHSAINNIRTMSLCWTSTTIHWIWWWSARTFENPKKKNGLLSIHLTSWYSLQDNWNSCSFWNNAHIISAE